MVRSSQRRLSAVCGHLLLQPALTEAGNTQQDRWKFLGSGANATSREGTWKDQSQLGNNGIALALPKTPTGPVKGGAKNIAVERIKDRTIGV